MFSVARAARPVNRGLTLIAACAALIASGPALADSARDASEVRTLVEKWAEARVKGDVSFLEAFYAPELRLQVADGREVSRDEDIALFAAGEIKPEFIRLSDVNVRMYGKTGVVTGVESLKGTYKGHPGQMSLRFITVLSRNDGRWRLVAAQSTRISGQ